jgi:hypothetical protein
MKFKCKVITPNGQEHIEEMTAPTKDKLRELYIMMGYQLVEIMGEVEQKNFLDDMEPELLAKLSQVNGGAVPNMGGGVTATPQPRLAGPAPVPEYKEYSDNGVDYRVETTSGKLQKHDWVKLSPNDLKNISLEHGGKMVTAYSQKLKLYRLEWIDVG